MQHDEWWVDVTYSMLEQMRRRLRLLVPLIERTKKSIVYTNFNDQLGDGTEVELPGIGGSVASAEFAQFRKKAEHFLKEHLAEAAVAKVRSGEPLTAADIDELQRILVAAGIGNDDTFEQASRNAGSFGLFIRSLVGLDRAAAKAAFAEFLDDKRYSKNQIKFVTLIIDELTEHGVVDAARVYESPYDSVAPTGPEALFPGADLDRLFATINVDESRRHTSNDAETLGLRASVARWPKNLSSPFPRASRPPNCSSTTRSSVRARKPSSASGSSCTTWALPGATAKSSTPAGTAATPSTSVSVHEK